MHVTNLSAGVVGWDGAIGDRDVWSPFRSPLLKALALIGAVGLGACSSGTSGAVNMRGDAADSGSTDLSSDRSAPGDAPDVSSSEARAADGPANLGETETAADTAAETAADAAADSAPSDAIGAFTLTSTAFREGEMIPLTYYCMHENVSPPLSWTAGPAGTQSYAVTMIHAIGDLALHWVLWDVAGDTRALPMNVAKVAEPPIPAGSKQDKTNIDSATWFGYVGPCPHGPSSNLFAVYAIDVAHLPGITTQSTPQQVEAVIKSHKLSLATLTGATNN